MKEAGLDEKKFTELLMKEEPALAQMSDEELSQINGGGFWDALAVLSVHKWNDKFFEDVGKAWKK